MYEDDIMKKSTVTVYSCEYCGEYFGMDKEKCTLHERNCTRGAELLGYLNRYYIGKGFDINTAYFPYRVENGKLTCAMFKVMENTFECGTVSIDNPDKKLTEATWTEWNMITSKIGYKLQLLVNHIHNGEKIAKAEKEGKVNKDDQA